MKYVYVLRCGSDHYKVGVAKDVKKRVQSLQTSNPNKIDIVSTRLVGEANKLEKIIHDFLSDHRLGGGTEWFKLSSNQVIEILIRINQIPEVAGLPELITEHEKLVKYELKIKDIDRNMKLIAKYIISRPGATYKPKTIEEITKTQPKKVGPTIDELADQAMKIFVQENRASTSLLQRRLAIGYAKASRIVDYLTQQGRLGESIGVMQGRAILDTAIMSKN